VSLLSRAVVVTLSKNDGGALLAVWGQGVLSGGRVCECLGHPVCLLGGEVVLPGLSQAQRRS
jgi:hypothetical protein